MSDRKPDHAALPPEKSPAARNVAEWLRQLERALRYARTHGAGADGVPALVARLVEDFADLLHYHAPLALRCTETELTLGAERVSAAGAPSHGEATPLEHAIPWLLHHDGIRAITFGREASRRDAQALVEALVRVVGSPGTDQDLVSLLWDAELDGMYVELAPLESIVGGPLAGTPAADAPPAGITASAPPDWTGPVPDSDAAEAWPALAEAEPEAMARWREAWARESARAWPERIAALVQAVRATDDGPATREALSGALAGALAAALRRGDWAEAAVVLEHVRAVDPAREWAPALLARALGAIDARALGERLDAASRDEQSRFITLMVRIGMPTLDLLVRVLARAGSARLRAQATTALSYVCADDALALGRHLRDARWHLARNIVVALGQIGGEQVVAPLTIALRHLDARVRRAALAALGSVPLHRRTPLLVAHLASADPATLPAVLAMLTRERDPEAAAALGAALAAPEYAAQTEEARVTLIEAAGEIGDDRVLPALEAVLNAGGWFARPGAERTAAARAIGRIGTVRALEVLSQGQRSRAESVRAACLEALSQTGRAA